ncbi:MAG: FAD-binding oxidoreductase [Synechococcales bacterium]|nr:FAD-binding oxidoreductase [Synechococcales bacterium]
MIPNPQQTRDKIQALAAIVGADQVTEWAQIEASFQDQLSQAIAPNSHPDCVVYPATPDELAAVMACAHRHGWRVLPCGSGSKLPWGGLAQDIQIVVSTARLNRLIDHAVGDLTVTAEAGMRFADLQEILGRSRQFLALDPSYAATATLGGIVATADAGYRRQRYGGVRDMLIGLSLVRSDGQVAKAGGRVVKNVAGYDLMKLLTGSWGTLGLLSQVTFRVYPLPDASQTVLLTGDAGAIQSLITELLQSALAPTAIALLSPALTATLTDAAALGLLVRFQALPISVEQQVAQLTALAQSHACTATLPPLPPDAPTGFPDVVLWQRLQEKIEAPGQGPALTGKIGVVPAQAVAALTKLVAIAPSPLLGQIQAGSGLGLIRLDVADASPELVAQMRQICQGAGGFLSVLAAPPAWKQSVDIWGYGGNAFALMQAIKHQFDPQRLLSPGRFVNGL